VKSFLKYFSIILCFLLLAAHFGRANLFTLQIVVLVIPFLLFWKNKIAAGIVQICLILGSFEWIRTLIYYARIRVENDEPWLRLSIILGLVAILTFATALIFRSKYMKERYGLQ